MQYTEPRWLCQQIYRPARQTPRGAAECRSTAPIPENLGNPHKWREGPRGHPHQDFIGKQRSGQVVVQSLGLIERVGHRFNARCFKLVQALNVAEDGREACTHEFGFCLPERQPSEVRDALDHFSSEMRRFGWHHPSVPRTRPLVPAPGTGYDAVLQTRPDRAEARSQEVRP